MDQYIESISNQRNANLAEQALLQRRLKELQEVEPRLSGAIDALVMVKQEEEKKSNPQPPNESN